MFLLYLSVKRATGLLVFLYYFVLPSLNKAITYLLTYLQGSRVFNGRDRCLLNLDSWKTLLSFCGKQNIQQGEPTIL